ncbi:MAG: cell division protein ZapA [Clostridia bacterium]|jgi:cell division protein ZapA|nr:cell division protein ZapA [Clostridia bacterium]
MAEIAKEKKRVAVSIFDQEYVVRSLEEEDYIQQLASFLDHKMREIHRMSPSLSAGKVAVLTALNLADELFKVRQEYEELLNLIEETKKGVGIK